MYSVLTRANAILAYTLSVLACLTICCVLSTNFLDYRTHSKISTGRVFVKNVPDYNAGREPNDLGYFKFDLNTNLSGLFNWNVKQLFLYLTAEYETKNNKLNQVVIWDKIIQRGENAVIDLKSEPLKYYFWDDGNGLRNHKNVTLYLSWNIIPNAGLLPNVASLDSFRIEIPDVQQAHTK